ncbi:MAG: DUF4097 family beta strand repeat-containing protein [Gemmatimonadota bacterium]
MISILLLVATVADLPMPQSGFATDTTITVQSGTRLKVQNQGGDITVKTWDRNQLRVQASHSARTYVDFEIRGAVVEVQAHGRRGPANVVDYQITAPAWMALELGGMYAEISVDGTRGPVKAETLEGNITIKGGGESVTVTSVNGRIRVEGAHGRMDLHSVSEGIEVAESQGDVTAETVSGDIRLWRVQAKTVDLQTVSGELLYDGPIVNGGSYSMLSHSGSVTLGVPEGTNATISLSSAMGEFNSSLDLKAERGTKRRQVYRLGSGSATVDLEAFSGEINLVRPSEISRARRHDRDEDRDDDERGAESKTKRKSSGGRPPRQDQNEEMNHAL